MQFRNLVLQLCGQCFQRSEGAGGRTSSWKLRPPLGRKEGASRGVGICRTEEAEPEDIVRGCMGLREGRCEDESWGLAGQLGAWRSCCWVERIAGAGMAQLLVMKSVSFLLTVGSGWLRLVVGWRQKTVSGWFFGLSFIFW